MEATKVSCENERLRSITRGVLDLQSFGGLTSAAFGLLIFAIEVKDSLPSRFNGLGHFLSFVACVTALLAYRYVPKYYERRFGHVEPPNYKMNRREAVVFMICVVLFLLYIFISSFIGIAPGRQLDTFFGNLSGQVHVLIHDPEHFVRFGPILYCAAIAIGGFSWRPKNTDRVFPLLMTLAVLFWIVFFIYPIHHPAVAQLLLWRIISTGWFGIALMTQGLHQHFEVILLLPKRPRAETEL